jgi:hypothetical protein
MLRSGFAAITRRGADDGGEGPDNPWEETHWTVRRGIGTVVRAAGIEANAQIPVSEGTPGTGFQCMTEDLCRVPTYAPCARWWYHLDQLRAASCGRPSRSQTAG